MGRLPRRVVGMSALLLVLFALQSVFVALRTELPAVAALHPLNGFAILALAIVTARASWIAGAGARTGDGSIASPSRRSAMPDALVLAGVLLVLAPLVGMVPVAYPPLFPAWSATREGHIALVGAHRRAWRLLNVGFGIATIGTAGGLAALAVALGGDDHAWRGPWPRSPSAYAMAGVPWLAVLAIRARATPALDDLGVTAAPAEPAEILLGAATGGLFVAFVLATGPLLSPSPWCSR